MTPLEAELASAGPRLAAEVMDLALYHPRWGYYRQADPPWGRDYVTALDAGPLLGEALALRLEQAWERLGRPESFTVLEPGAGRGWLGRDLLTAAGPAFARALRYVHRDDGPAGRALAREALAPWLAEGRARFVDQGEPLAPFVGAVVSLELFDALPAQPYRWHGEGWEVEVRADGTSAWRPAEPDEATRWFEAAGDLQPGDGAPWCPGLAPLARELAAVLAQGLFLAVDYGHGTRHLLQKGTGLRRFRAHRTDGRWWEEPGAWDLTADVDFTRLAGLLEACGLEVAPDRTLGAWIREHAPLAAWEAQWGGLEAPERLRRMGNLLELTLPGRMGERFRVLEALRT